MPEVAQPALGKRAAGRSYPGGMLRITVLGVMIATLLASCGQAPGSAGSITLYSGQHEQTTDALVAAFQAATGVRVYVHNDDEDTLAEQIVAEGAHSPADVVFTENSPALEFLQDRGLLARVDPSTLSSTPPRYNSPAGDWVGISARVSVIVYNPRLIPRSQLPAHAIELAGARYHGKLALAPGETDFQPIVTSVERSYGRAAALAWLRGLKANAGSHEYPDNESLCAAVNRGEVAFGVVNQYYWYRLRAQTGASNMHSDVTYFAPRDPGYVIDDSGAGVLKSSRHRGDAQRFLAFITSRKGQEIIAHSTSFEYPIASGVATTQRETPFSELRANSISIAELGDGSSAIGLLQSAGML